MSREFWGGVVIGLLFGLFVGFFGGLHLGESHLRALCIGAGVGEWHINPETGEASFEFKRPGGPQ